MSICESAVLWIELMIRVRLHGRHLTSAQFTLQADLKEPGYPNNTDGTIIDVTGSDGNVGWALFHLQDPTARA